MTATNLPRTGDSHPVHGSPSDHLANERTYLAWLRTAIALLSFGITLNRFSLYLQQSNRLTPDAHFGVLRDSADVGTGMVVLGMIMMVGAAVRYGVTAKRIQRGTVGPNTLLIWIIT